jgi:hypothetical protein
MRSNFPVTTAPARFVKTYIEDGSEYTSYLNKHRTTGVKANNIKHDKLTLQ